MVNGAFLEIIKRLIVFSFNSGNRIGILTLADHFQTE